MLHVPDTILIDHRAIPHLLGALGAQLAGAGRYQLMLNEYDMDEIEASSLAGIASYIHLVSGIATAPLVDLVGIRTMALASIVLSIVKSDVEPYIEPHIFSVECSK